MKYLTVCAIFKDETPFLKEWLDYHLVAGVEHFCLCCNDEDDTEAKAVLAPYMDKIDYSHRVGQELQLVHYEDTINQCKDTTRWLAFVDLDEFILPVEKPTIPEGLVEYEPYGGLALNMICFGSCGLVDPPVSQLRQLYKRLPDKYGWPGHTFIKSIVNPKVTIRHHKQPHACDYEPGYFAVNTKHQIVTGHHIIPEVSEKMRINHYYTRSAKWWLEKKMKRGRADMTNAFSTYYWDTFLVVEENATIIDTLIWDKFGKLL